MLSYDEIMDISKKYRYNYNKETQSHYIIDKDTKTELTNMDDYEIMKIKAAIGLNTYMKHIQSSLPIYDLPYHNATEQNEWEKNFFEVFQESISKIALKGQLSTNTVINMHPAHHYPQEHFFFAMKKNGLEYNRDCYESLMSYLLSESGKKMSDFTISDRTSGTDIDFTWSVKEMSFNEKLNPSNPQYTQPEKPKQATPEQQARRREFAEKLITYYLKAETDAMYDERVEGEDKNMRFAARAINNSQQIHIEQKDFPKLMRLLLAAKNISLDGQTDYFEKIISQPEISKALAEIRDSGQFDKVKSIAERNEQEGKLTNGKLKGHNETKGELGLRIANRTIERNPGFVEKATRFISSRSKFSVNEQSDAIALSAVARTQGKIPSYTKNENGTFDFNSDEEITR